MLVSEDDEELDYEDFGLVDDIQDDKFSLELLNEYSIEWN
jgi:hypothetical protein